MLSGRKCKCRLKTEICSKFTIKTPGVTNVVLLSHVYFDQISHFVLLFPLLTLNKSLAAGYTKKADFHSCT